MCKVELESQLQNLEVVFGTIEEELKEVLDDRKAYWGFCQDNELDYWEKPSKEMWKREKEIKKILKDG